MRRNQLPAGITVITGTWHTGETRAASVEGDIRIIESKWDMRRPYIMQALVRTADGDAWRDLQFSVGRGRPARKGFHGLNDALTAMGELRRQIHGDGGA